MHALEKTRPGTSDASSSPESPPGWLDARRFSLMLAALVFLAFPTVLLGLRTFVFRDFGLFSYPVASFSRECFWRGELPLWNPFSNCGLPFLAQWNTMVLYPPSLVYLLLPLTWSLPFFCLLHLFWGGLGMYLLARRWTDFKFAGGLAGILFAFNGLNLNFLMWPSHVATFSWLPWVLLLGQDGWRAGGRRLVWAIAAAAMQMLAGGPETILVTWVLLGLLAVGDSLQKTTPLRLVAFRLAAMALTVALICAAQLLPFLQLLAHSQRDSGYGALARSWAMPISGWANFLVPLFRTTPTPEGVWFQNQQYWTSSYYAGIGTVWLGLVAVRRLREWRVHLLAGVVLIGLLLALGDGGVLYRFLRSLAPAIEIVRYPVKFVIVLLALAPVLGAYGMSALVCQRGRFGRFEWASALVLLALVAIIVAAARNSPTDVWRATWQNGLSRAVLLTMTVFLVWMFVRESSRVTAHPTYAILIIGGLLLLASYLDLVTHMPNQNPLASSDVFAPGLTRAQLRWNPGPSLGSSRAMESPTAQEALKYKAISDPGKHFLLARVGLLADCNLLENVPQVHGFFSLTPGEINDATAAPYVQTNRDFSPLLDFMAVKYMTTENFDSVERPTALPWVTAGQLPVYADDRTIFSAFSQTNADLSRILFLPLSARGGISATPQPTARVTQARFANQRISFSVEAPGPSMAVVSQTYYPAWRAYVDGNPAKLWRANYAFQAVEVPTGTHTVQLRYEDRAFWFGVILSAAGLLVGAVLWRWPRLL